MNDIIFLFKIHEFTSKSQPIHNACTTANYKLLVSYMILALNSGPQILVTLMTLLQRTTRTTESDFLVLENCNMLCWHQTTWYYNFVVFRANIMVMVPNSLTFNLTPALKKKNINLTHLSNLWLVNQTNMILSTTLHTARMHEAL